MCFGLFGCEDDNDNNTGVSKAKVARVEESNDASRTVSTADKRAQAKLDDKACCICKSRDVKYRCPECQLRTCCLDCVKKHKDVFSCSGKREKTLFVKMSDFDQKEFLNDYFFLEETEQLIDRAARNRRQVTKCYSNQSELPAHLMKLRFEARKSGTRLKILPKGFKKRMENETIYFYSGKEIQWTINWVFHDYDYHKENDEQSLKVFEFMDKRVSEKKVIQDILKQVYFHPEDPLENYDRVRLLSNFIDKNLAVFLRMEPRNVKSPTTYLPIDPNCTLTKALEGKTVVEYPTFIIVNQLYKDKYQENMKPIPALENQEEKEEGEVSDSDDE